MYLDTDALAQKLYDGSLTAREVPFKDVRPMLQGAPYGIEPLDEPDLYRWFLVGKFPVEAFGITIEEMLKEAGPRHSDDLWRHNRIVDLLQEGKPAWAAFATASGVIIDGYHRIAAHRTLGDKDMSVVVAVKRAGGTSWDEAWNEASKQKSSKMIKAYHAIGTGIKTPDYRAIQADLFDRIASQGSVFPARGRLTQKEIRRRCVPSELKEFLGVEGDLFEECRKNSPNAWRAIGELIEEVVETLPLEGESSTKFTCLDLLAGDLDRIFLTVDHWFGNIQNGFVFNAEDLIRNGAVVRHRDILDDVYRTLERICGKDFSTVAGARRSIQRAIRKVIGENTYYGLSAIEFLEDCVKRPPCIAEVVWTGPLPLEAAIEAWRDGVQVYP